MRRRQNVEYTKYLAEQLGWTVDTSGRRWAVLETSDAHADPERSKELFEGLDFRPRELLGLLMRTAIAPPEFGGEGLDPEELGEQLSEYYGRPRMLPSGTAAGDEGTFYRVWPHLKGED